MKKWKVSALFVRDEDDRFICDCRNAEAPEGEELANARQVATLPDLLEVVQLYQAWHDDVDVKAPYNQELAAIIRKGRAALEKVEP